MSSYKIPQDLQVLSKKVTNCSVQPSVSAIFNALLNEKALLNASQALVSIPVVVSIDEGKKSVMVRKMSLVHKS